MTKKKKPAPKPKTPPIKEDKQPATTKKVKKPKGKNQPFYGTTYNDDFNQW